MTKSAEPLPIVYSCMTCFNMWGLHYHRSGPVMVKYVPDCYDCRESRAKTAAHDIAMAGIKKFLKIVAVALVVLLLLLLSSTHAGQMPGLDIPQEYSDKGICPFCGNRIQSNPCTDSLLTIDTVGFEEKADICDHYSKEYICAVLHQVTWRPVLCSTYVSYVVKDTVGWEKQCWETVEGLKPDPFHRIRHPNEFVPAIGIVVKHRRWVPIVKKRCCK